MYSLKVPLGLRDSTSWVGRSGRVSSYFYRGKLQVLVIQLCPRVHVVYAAEIYDKTQHKVSDRGVCNETRHNKTSGCNKENWSTPASKLEPCFFLTVGRYLNKLTIEKCTCTRAKENSAR